MGYMRSAGMRECIDDGLISLECALADHFMANFYPPITIEVIPFAVKAIDYCNAEEWDEEITFPNGRIITAGEMVNDLHLEPFLGIDE